MSDAENLLWWICLIGWSAGVLLYLGAKVAAWWQCRPYYKSVDAKPVPKSVRL